MGHTMLRVATLVAGEGLTLEAKMLQRHHEGGPKVRPYVANSALRVVSNSAGRGEDTAGMAHAVLLGTDLRPESLRSISQRDFANIMSLAGGLATQEERRPLIASSFAALADIPTDTPLGDIVKLLEASSRLRCVPNPLTDGVASRKLFLFPPQLLIRIAVVLTTHSLDASAIHAMLARQLAGREVTITSAKLLSGAIWSFARAQHSALGAVAKAIAPRLPGAFTGVSDVPHLSRLLWSLGRAGKHTKLPEETWLQLYCLALPHSPPLGEVGVSTVGSALWCIASTRCFVSTNPLLVQNKPALLGPYRLLRRWVAMTPLPKSAFPSVLWAACTLEEPSISDAISRLVLLNPAIYRFSHKEALQVLRVMMTLRYSHPELIGHCLECTAASGGSSWEVVEAFAVARCLGYADPAAARHVSSLIKPPEMYSVSPPGVWAVVALLPGAAPAQALDTFFNWCASSGVLGTATPAELRDLESLIRQRPSSQGTDALLQSVKDCVASLLQQRVLRQRGDGSRRRG